MKQLALFWGRGMWPPWHAVSHWGPTIIDSESLLSDGDDLTLQLSHFSRHRIPDIVRKIYFGSCFAPRGRGAQKSLEQFMLRLPGHRPR